MINKSVLFKAQENNNEPDNNKHGKQPLKLSQTLLLGFLLMFILVSIIGLVFYFLGKSQNTGTKNPTLITTSTQENGWKTYTNAKYNFTVDYPSDWSVREYPDSKDGASFNPPNDPGYPDKTDAIEIYVRGTLLNYTNLTFEEYAKMAGRETQNYNELATIKKVVTSNGTVGYETTWMVQPLTINGIPPADGESESLPITYFEIPGNKTSLVRVILNGEEFLDVYEKMLKTVVITTPATSSQDINETEVLENVIKKYIAVKNNVDKNSLTISVSEIEGNYAKGEVSDTGGGGMWFATKEEGAWALVWDGNGIIECSLFTLYPDFSKSLIPECYDTEKQDIVKR